jgi:hypothetical protein
MNCYLPLDNLQQGTPDLNIQFKKKSLILDPWPLSRRILKEKLESFGSVVEAVDKPEDMKAMIEAFHPNVAFLDNKWEDLLNELQMVGGELTDIVMIGPCKSTTLKWHLKKPIRETSLKNVS